MTAGQRHPGSPKPASDELRAFYERYNEVCNRHAFDELEPFVHDEVTVNGRARTREEYAADLGRVPEAFPDYRWTIQRMVVEPPWLSVHLVDSGTHRGPWLGRPGTGRAAGTDEFAMYRVVDGRIAQIWVAADNARLLGL